MNKLEEVLETPPKGLASIAALYQWGTNYDHGNNPFVLFLDLIGWSNENVGSAIYVGNMEQGAMEADLIALALMAYANAPYDAHDYCSKIVYAED